MATTIRDYPKLAADICDAVGKDNIISAAHCATRLRLVLKETPSAEVTQRISEMPAVIKVMESGGQYQVVIGTHAKDVYEALAQLLDLDENAADAPQTKQGIGSRIIATMSAVFAPFVYILAAAGLVQGALIIITHFAPAFAETGAQLHQLDTLHLPAGDDRRHRLQALQVQHLHRHVVLSGTGQLRLGCHCGPHRFR